LVGVKDPEKKVKLKFQDLFCLVCTEKKKERIYKTIKEESVQKIENLNISLVTNRMI
jgi:hypothetical protein